MSSEPLRNRPPTAHERMSHRPWDASYQDGPPPWDIGHPQPVFARLVAAGKFASPVLDAGCGTGEHALLLASLGLSVLGFDVAETALARARQKALDRKLSAEFVAADALHLDTLGRSFQTVLDCGLFHAFDADERRQYAASLAQVTTEGAMLYLLCFSDQGPDIGPHPITRQDLQAAFSSMNGWNIQETVAERVHTRFHEHGAPAWLAAIKRT
jgi:SAM-dependent methyltransferase